MPPSSEIEKLKEEIRALKQENRKLRNSFNYEMKKDTVIVPDEFKSIFKQAQNSVNDYFSNNSYDPDSAEIIINGERYVLLRSCAISYEFVEVFKELYSNRGEEEAVRIGNNFLFDIAHLLGREDAKAFHRKMDLTDPIQKLSAGPVHFAFTGWANVEMLPESNPSPDNDYFIKYIHHNSFEAQAYIKAGKKTENPVCMMNAGYSSGWCEESFGLSLTAVEICCEAQGADHCTFIMAPAERIHEYLEKEANFDSREDYDVPIFFQRKYAEDKLKESLRQKDTLLKEVHHRVKNNLQVISSLLKLQKEALKDDELAKMFDSSIMRVNTMAYIHEIIYGSRDVSSINIEKYFKKLLQSLAQFYRTDDQRIEIELSIDAGNLFLFPDTVIPLGLILNEVACNSFKYAFKEDDEGKFYLHLTEKDGYYNLVVGDNGKGITKMRRSDESLGMSLVEILCDQIDAKLEQINSKEGLEYRIIFEHLTEKA